MEINPRSLPVTPPVQLFSATIALARKLNVELSLPLPSPSTLHPFEAMSRFHPASLVDPRDHSRELLDFLELDARNRCIIGKLSDLRSASCLYLRLTFAS